MNVPKLRFKEFDGEWEEKKLKEVSTYSNGGSYENDVKNEGNYQLVTLKSVDMQGNLCNSGKYLDKEAPTLECGTLVMILSEQSPGLLGMTAQIPESNKYVLNQRVAEIKPNNNINSTFLSMVINRNQKYFSKKGAGTKVQNISKGNVENYEFYSPNFKEQEKIGHFFETLDKKIQIQQQKIDLLQEQKKGFLQKMFPKAGETQPEMRFDGFTGDWEVYKWVDTVDISTNMVDPKNVEYDEFLHIGPGNIESFTGRILDNVNTVKEDNLISGKFHFKAGDIIYGKINPQLAKYTLVDFEGLASADAYILNAKNGINQQYLYTILQGEKFYKYSVSVSMRTGMPKINRDELNQYNYLAPNLKEQQKIGEFFKGLDNKIEVQKRKLQLLQKQKQGFMQQMFI